MKRVCVLVPTWNRRFEDLQIFFQSYIKYELDRTSDLCFIMSDADDDSLLREKYPSTQWGGVFNNRDA